MRGELVVESGPRKGERFVIRLAQRFLIGRGRGVPIQIEDDLISRRHALVELRADGWLYLRDLGSRNGTFFRGQQLAAQAEVQLSAGDRFELGIGCVLRVELTGDPIKSVEEILPPEEFELLGELGAGATGKVFVAKQRLLDRVVAVKVYFHVEDPSERERTMKEARIAMRVQSPHVVEVYDVRLFQDRLCLIMELVNGPSLHDILRSGKRIDIPEALALGEDIAHALVEAHASQVIHRDVKPANVILSPDGVGKLTDFGIAKDLSSNENLTDSNLGLGSLPFVSPEQAGSANRVDERSDIYSLGATLYNLIGNQPPFSGSKARILFQIVEAEPTPLSSLAAGCPESVADFVHAMLAKNPDDRPGSAADVLRRLRDLRAEHYGKFVPPDPSRRTSADKETRAGPLDSLKLRLETEQG